jgi:transposase
MSNRIKSGYDTYKYAGAEELSQLIDDTILAALEGGSSETQKTDIERRRQEELDNIGQKAVQRRLQDLREATSEKQIAQAIINITKNVERGATITKEEQNFVDQKIQELNNKGFEIVNYNNQIYNSGLNVTINNLKELNEDENLTEEQIASLEKELENRKKKREKLKEKGLSEEQIDKYFEDTISIMTTVQPQLNKDGEMVQAAKVDAVLIEVSDAEKVLERSKKNPRNTKTERVDKINAKYDAELTALGELTEGGQLTQAMIDDFMVALEEADLPGVNSNKYTLPIVRDELETLIAPEGTRLTKKTQKNVSRLENSIAEIDSKLAETKDAKRQAALTKQKESLQKALASEQAGEYNEKFELTGANLKTFVSNVVKENAYQESRDGGDLIDPMLKAYLDTATSVKPEFNPDLMTKEAYDALFDDETGYLTQIKKLADSGEIYIFTKDLIVHSNNLKNAEGESLTPVAGEIDMIIVDKKGNKYIVDLKTGKTDKWMNYKVMNTKSFQKQLENTLQQTGYANLAENMSGQKFGIKIFPIEVSYDKKGKMISAGKPTNPILFGDEETIGDEGTFPYTITLSSDNIIRAKDPETGYYEDMSIANLMQKLVPNMAVKGEIKPGKVSKAKPKMVPEEEKAFVDSYVEKLNELGETSNEEALMDLIEDLDKNKPYLSSQTYNMLKTMLDNEASKILDELGNIDVKLGEIYIFTQPVKSMKIPQGYRVLVKSIDPENGTVELERVGPGRKKPITMNAADFNDVTMNEESLNNVPQAQEQYEPTQDELANISESMSVISDELSDFEQVAKWNEEASADNVSLDQLKNNFFDNFKCPIR